MSKLNQTRQAVIKISSGMMIVILLATALLGYIYIYDGDISDLSTAPSLGGASTPTTQYMVGFTFADDNAIDGSAVTTTTPIYGVYNSDGRRLSGVSTLFGESGTSIASGATATNVVVYPEDGDYLFVNVDTGTTDFVDPAKFLATNPTFTSCKWMPVSSNNIPELVCELQISKLGSPNYQVSPSLTGHLKVPALPDDLGVTLDSPADQTSIGTTSATDVYITWTGSALAANQGWTFAKIWITSNQTALDFAALDFTIDSAGSLTRMSTFSNADPLYISSAYDVSGTAAGIDQTWRYYPADESVSSDYTNTLLVGRGSSNQDALKFTLHLQTYFSAAGHGATVVLNVQLISAANALQTSVTDSVTISG